MANIHKGFAYIDDRDSGTGLAILSILDRMGWTHYPENVTGEEIDAGDDSDAAKVETVEIPSVDMDIWELLEDILSD